MTNAAEIDPHHLDFDPDALRVKYRAERDKRLRPEGNDQYRRIEGSLAHYAEDITIDFLDSILPVSTSIRFPAWIKTSPFK